MAANARRCPVSAQCGILGVPRSTYYRMLAHPPRPKAPDPIEPDVLREQRAPAELGLGHPQALDVGPGEEGEGRRGGLTARGQGGRRAF